MKISMHNPMFTRRMAVALRPLLDALCDLASPPLYRRHTVKPSALDHGRHRYD
jgi:hypothetical protein